MRVLCFLHIPPAFPPPAPPPTSAPRPRPTSTYLRMLNSLEPAASQPSSLAPLPTSPLGRRARASSTDSSLVFPLATPHGPSAASLGPAPPLPSSPLRASPRPATRAAFPPSGHSAPAGATLAQRASMPPSTTALFRFSPRDLDAYDMPRAIPSPGSAAAATAAAAAAAAGYSPLATSRSTRDFGGTARTPTLGASPLSPRGSRRRSVSPQAGASSPGTVQVRLPSGPMGYSSLSCALPVPHHSAC